jgi:hypothetical protein
LKKHLSGIIPFFFPHLLIVLLYHSMPMPSCETTRRFRGYVKAPLCRSIAGGVLALNESVCLPKVLDNHFSYLSYSLAHVLCILVFFCFGERNVIVPSPAPVEAVVNRKIRRVIVDSSHNRIIG